MRPVVIAFLSLLVLSPLTGAEPPLSDGLRPLAPGGFLRQTRVTDDGFVVVERDRVVVLRVSGQLPSVADSDLLGPRDTKPSFGGQRRSQVSEGVEALTRHLVQGWRIARVEPLRQSGQGVRLALVQLQGDVATHRMVNGTMQELPEPVMRAPTVVTADGEQAVVLQMVQVLRVKPRLAQRATDDLLGPRLELPSRGGQRRTGADEGTPALERFFVDGWRLVNVVPLDDGTAPDASVSLLVLEAPFLPQPD